MPVYEYFCEGCKKEVTRTMSISEHDKGGAVCPECGGRSLRPPDLVLACTQAIR